jgi:hypothetical protein
MGLALIIQIAPSQGIRLASSHTMGPAVADRALAAFTLASPGLTLLLQRTNRLSA